MTNQLRIRVRQLITGQYVGRWLAEIGWCDGNYWYEDFDMYSHGATKEKAIANVLKKAREIATALSSLTEKDLIE